MPPDECRAISPKFALRIVPKLVPYAVTALVVGATIAAGLFFHIAHIRSGLFFLVVLATSWYAGFGAGLFASVLSVLALNYFFLEPDYSFAVTSEDFIELMIFCLVAAITSKFVAERRRTNNALAELNRDLERRVADRTAELKAANDNLRNEIEARASIQQKLTRSVGELEHFAHVLSHDILVPLRTIASTAVELRQRPKDEAQTTELLNQIELTAEHIQAFVSGALSFARVNSQRNIAAGDVSMEATLHWALLNLKNAIDESHASITHDSLPNITGDQAQIADLLQNLISNAIKYRRSDPPRIHVSAVPSSDTWVFTVKDNGIGIPPEYHESVFELFKRLHPGSEYPGSGLGLAISRKIVERHGGRIWLDSTPGVGSTFYFTLGESSQTSAGSGAIDHPLAKRSQQREHFQIGVTS